MVSYTKSKGMQRDVCISFSLSTSTLMHVITTLLFVVNNIEL